MQDTIMISFTPQQLDAVANALGNAPYVVAAPVIDAIRQQVAAQNQPPGLPPIEPPPADGSQPLQ
jgi:hypothetical protein